MVCDVYENVTKLDVVPEVIFDEIYCEGCASHMLRILKLIRVDVNIFKIRVVN